MSMPDPFAQQDSRPETPAAAVAPLRRDDFDRDVWCLMGLAVDAADITWAMAEIDDAARTRRQLSFVTPNVNFLVRAMADDAARREILNADLSLADGAPLVAMAKLLGVPVPSRVAGSDLFDALRRRPGFGRRIKVFFFGGRDGAAEAAFKAISRERGGVEAVGWLNPGFGDVDSMSADAVIDEINAAGADFVVVALGAGKGQAWIDRNRDRLTAPVTAHLGAVVDFAAGGIARAPVWLRETGLEWVWRIKEEPALWRRYFRDGLGLIRLALTGLLPQLGLGRTGQGGRAGQADIEPAVTETVIRLSGDLGHHNLAPVRNAFRAAVARGLSVRLDFTAAGRIDRAFLGQVLMLEKQLARRNAEIRIAGAGRDVGALLRANRMPYAQAAMTAEAGSAAAARRAVV